MIQLSFNPRTHMGCDMRKTLIGISKGKFQSTHPHGVRHNAPPSHTGEACFNPRTHMGCDSGWFYPYRRVRVSIHAPTWGATPWNKFCTFATVFQSTHPHGVRLYFTHHSSSFASFNPRTHMGCDSDSLSNAKTVIVSIHAPTWGATLARRWAARFTSFNPRTHMGCDRGNREHPCRADVSIHAPTWGATDLRFASSRDTPSFNPRTHMGCDLAALQQYYAEKFQSTHPHGVRLVCDRYGVTLLSVSIHAPTWGATRKKDGFEAGDCGFNPRTHMGCDYGDTYKRVGTIVSIHAPTWGATQC